MQRYWYRVEVLSGHDTYLYFGSSELDEAAAMELAGHAVQLVEGRPDNIKVTRSADLEQAEQIIAALGQ